MMAGGRALWVVTGALAGLAVAVGVSQWNPDGTLAAVSASIRG